jgi:putative membrane protein
VRPGVRTVVSMNAFQHIAPVLADHGWHDRGAWWFPFGLLWLLAFAALIWFVFRNTRTRDRTATDILAERFARGEISAEEYRDRLAELGSHK